MRIRNRRWTGAILGTTLVLVALGVALGDIVSRVGQSAAGTLTLSSSAVVSSGDLALWHDRGKNAEVTSVQFEGLALQPPLSSIVNPAVVYIENLSTADLFLVKPCGTLVDSATNTQIGSMDAEVFSLEGIRLGNTCDVPNRVKLSSGDLARTVLRIDLEGGLTSRDYGFLTVFEAVSPIQVKVAFIGDQGLTLTSRASLQLIKDEVADVVLHQGDFDYADDPEAWDQQINDILGPNFPYFASIGNHDVLAWPGYQQKLQARLDRVGGAICTGDLGVKSACTYQGLFFVLSGAGTKGSDHATYIRDRLAFDKSTWRICSWHKPESTEGVGVRGILRGRKGAPLNLG